MDHKRALKKLRVVRKDVFLVTVASVALLALVAFTFYMSHSAEWTDYQADFRDVVAEKFGPDRAASAPQGLQQIHVDALGRTDRCTTCHMGVEWKGLENAPEPFRTHPGAILAKHPLLAYGCTVCHGGQGYATDFASAHGPVDDWEEPVLGAELGDFYVLSNKKAMMQLNCNICHRYDRQTEGADAINRAKQLVQEKGCRACHVINGRGGTVGPDLTWEGSKSPEQFNYERMKGLHSEFTWQVAHLKNPKEIVEGSIMPNFNFSGADAQALSLMVMSWKKEAVPVEYVPGHNFRDVPTREELEREDRMMKGPGSFFVKKNCFLCHSVSTLGIDAAAQIGPDLALAVEDVQARFGRTLDDFLARPTGTMEVVLSTMITLTPEERNEAIDKLRQAFTLKQQQAKLTK